MSLESILRSEFNRNNLVFRDYTNSMTKLDFTLHLSNGVYLKVDAKEKRQPLKRANWAVPEWVTEGNEFILDDLSARKLLLVAPYSAIVVEDVPREKFFVASVLTIWLMPRVRINRKTSKHNTKGKWLLSLENFTAIEIDEIVQYFEQVFSTDMISNEYKTIPECFGSFIGESISYGGEYRTREMRDYDYAVTR